MSDVAGYFVDTWDGHGDAWYVNDYRLGHVLRSIKAANEFYG